MNVIYFAIAALSLFSDLLLKGYLPGSVALMTQYTLAVVILVLINALNGKGKYSKYNSNPAFFISLFVFFLLFQYSMQMLLAFNVPITHSATHMGYICIPLLFVVVVLWRCPEFDLAKQANIFLLMMIPVNLVGIIQFFVDGNFLISNAYNESGGIIFRNTDFGAFARYPSIFVSADRYSAIGLIQLYFTVVLLYKATEKTFKSNFWVYFNFISGLLAILIAGARSRIFIVLTLLLLMALSLLIFRGFRGISRNGFNAKLASFLVLLAAGALFFMNSPKSESDMSSFPVMDLFIDSIAEGKTEERIFGYITRTTFSEEVTLFGEGLGSLGPGGKPAEVGIESIWIECGVVGGALILMGFLGLLSVLSFLAIKSFIRGSPIALCIFALPTLALVMGLLTGLASVFELSSSMLLMTAIGASIPKKVRIKMVPSRLNHTAIMPSIQT